MDFDLDRPICGRTIYGADMNTQMIRLLNEYIKAASRATDAEALGEIKKTYRGRFDAEFAGAGDRELFDAAASVFEAISELVSERNDLKRLCSQHIMTDIEAQENKRVQRILDLNLLTYHFQPIIRVDDGQIFAYEALMRSREADGITPFHILKYAALTDRLGDVEKYTFINVLSYVRDNPTMFEGRKVFINSLPSVRVDGEGHAQKELLLASLPDKIVVEMTESAEFSDEELNAIKSRYDRLNVPIAIDDYGTGYSNINNLLRYTPNFVKIDRSLLSGIQDNPNKKHFVREIIDFCHANSIMALAEGVETADELRTVILLGVDLIQGFYTARPAATVLQALPFELRSEISAYRREREDGKKLRLYCAQSGETVPVDKLCREGYRVIRIGSDDMSGTVTITSAPEDDSEIHIEVADGFSGRVILNSATLKNSVGSPCIDIGSGCDLTLELIKKSSLIDGGIRVPANSRLYMEGLGNLDITLGNSNYYGIGNDAKSAHGRLIFDQEGTISISAVSYAGVLIGSGLGGEINIMRGKYILNARGSMNVCLGSLDGDTTIELHGCDFDCNAAGAVSIIAGSMSGNSDIHCIYSSIKARCDSQLAVGFGSLHRGGSRIFIESAHIDIEANADNLTVMGSMTETSDIRLERSSINLVAEGSQALLFGGFTGGTQLSVADIDIYGELNSDFDTCLVADAGDVNISGGKFRFLINRNETDRII